jgi:plastocyanin
MVLVRGLAILISVVVAVACNEPGSGNTCKSTGAVTVDATDGSGFLPNSVSITVTQRVCWQNLGNNTHTITSSTISDSTNITLPPDYTYTKGFGRVGDFPYRCTLHTGETGLVQVR